MNKLEIAVARAAEAWANAEYASAKNIGAGGPGKADVAEKAEQRFRAALSALAAIQPQPDAAAGWVSVEEWLPEPSKLVVVFTPWCENDWPGSVNIGLDCIDPNDDDHASWEGHNNHYEHYCCVAKGMENCTGPSEKAPYTHWHALADPPPVQAQGSDAA